MSGERSVWRFGDAGGKKLVHLFPHRAGSAVQDVEKGLIFAVHVGNKVLGALGQIQNGLEIDDLGTGRLYRGILPGQHLKIVQIRLCLALLALHGTGNPPYPLV